MSEGPGKVVDKETPDAKTENRTNILVKVTTISISGSDLHMYEGRRDMETRPILGHENSGVAIEVGNTVDQIEVDDRFCLPFNVGCGFCRNCEEGFTDPARRPIPTQTRPAPPMVL